MDWVIEYLEDLVAFVKKETQIANTALFNAGGSGLVCMVIPEGIDAAGPSKVGRELRVTVRLTSPVAEWKMLFQAMAKLDKIFTNFTSTNNDLKFRLAAVPGNWSRTNDDSTVIFSLALVLRGIRMGA